MNLREAELTWGVWLPIAMARVVQTIAGAFGERLAVSEILGSFALPGLAAAAARDEEQGRQAETMARFEELARKYGKHKSGT